VFLGFSPERDPYGHPNTKFERFDKDGNGTSMGML